MSKDNDDSKLERLKGTVDITIDLLSLMGLIAAIQMASRNPRWYGESRDLAITTARQLQIVLCDKLPEYSAIMEMGWNPDFDM